MHDVNSFVEDGIGKCCLYVMMDFPCMPWSMWSSAVSVHHSRIARKVSTKTKFKPLSFFGFHRILRILKNVNNTTSVILHCMAGADRVFILCLLDTGRVYTWMKSLETEQILADIEGGWNFCISNAALGLARLEA